MGVFARVSRDTFFGRFDVSFRESVVGSLLGGLSLAEETVKLLSHN